MAGRGSVRDPVAAPPSKPARRIRHRPAGAQARPRSIDTTPVSRQGAVQGGRVRLSHVERPRDTRGGERHPHRGDWLRDAVLGLNDGLVTTLVFVMTLSGVAGSRHALLASALAELFAGGVSMAFGGFIAARTQREVMQKRRATERLEIATEPDEERLELRAIYRGKGFSGPLLEAIVTHLTATPERWLSAMMHDEHGVTAEPEIRPLLSGLSVGVSFMIGAVVPILPFFFAQLAQLPAQIVSFMLTASVSLGLGAVKSRHTLKGPLRSGLELLALAALGALCGVLIGHLLESL